VKEIIINETSHKANIVVK